MQVRIKRLNENAVIPKHAYAFDAGVDLVATEDVVVGPGETAKIPTGIAISMPPGYEAQVRPRSSVTLKTKLRVQLGTIDAGYTGEIGVIVDNINYDMYLDHSPMVSIINGSSFLGKNGETYPVKSYLVRKGDRIAQLVFSPVEQAKFIEVDTLEQTQRGEDGFGSSGVK